MSNVLKFASVSSGAAVQTDPDFKSTILLLHGDGTNGAQNNTFLDSSTNNWTITRNGNPTQGTFSPFSNPDGYWCVDFDGTDDRLEVADNAVLRPGTSAFTIEAWIYRRVSGVAHTICAKGGTGTGWVLQVTSGNLLQFVNSSTNINSTGTIPDGEWVHVAAVREGTGTNQFKLYINGVNDGTATVNTDFNQTNPFKIGENRSNGNDFNGFISNLRYTIGSALYTGTFTPSTQPLTTTSQGASSSQVELLACQSNRFIDNSTNDFSVTVAAGTPNTLPLSPFNTLSALDSTLSGGSCYFDGAGNYLSIADDAALRFGTGNFTIQAWVYKTNTSINPIASKGGSGTGWNFQITNTDVLIFQYGGSNITGSTVIQLNTWTHVAVVREGTGTNQTKLYINGVLEAQGTVTTDFNQTENLFIGANRLAANGLVGFIGQLKITVGTAETITTPTSLLTGGTVLLNFSNAGIFDNTRKNNLDTVGNAQIDTTTKKFGTGSIEFDGTGDWLLINHLIYQQFLLHKFTIEFWVYLASGDTGLARGLVSKGGATSGWLVSLDSSEKVVFTYGTNTITSSASISTNAWNHIAVVREGTGSNQTKIYINGTNDGTGTVSTNFTQTAVMYVGANRTGGDPMKGFIDDLRITNGVARYTANFTPPTQAFPNL